MKRAIIVCLTIISLLAFDSTAEAGRRKDRRASRKSGGGVYAGAYQKRSSQSYAAAPAYTPTPATAASSPAPAIATAPDLTITEIAAVGDVLAFTVKNVGQVPSPECRLEIVIAKPQAAEMDADNVRVLPLLPNQSVKIRVRSVPVAHLHANAFVDPDHLVAESNEENNDLDVTLATEATPPVLTDESVWSHVGG